MSNQDCRKRELGRGSRSRPGIFALVALAAPLLLAPLPSGLAQPTIDVPDTRGDQLIFFYDARPGRVPYLSVSNPSSESVRVEVTFYPTDLSGRLAGVAKTLPSAGNVLIDPSMEAGAVAIGTAGVALVTPVSEASGAPVVPPEPLVGNFTLANLELNAAFGENALGRFAVTQAGERAQAGQAVNGAAVRYQSLHPAVLMIPAYFNPTTLSAPARDGNRVILAGFVDLYGADRFDIGPLNSDSREVETFFFNDLGQLIAQSSVMVAGVLLSDLQQLAGVTELNTPGKVFFEIGERALGENVFGIFSQSLETFASGQRMPAVATVPSAAASSATPRRSPTPAATPSSAASSRTVMVGQNGHTFTPDSLTIHAGDSVRWVWANGGHNVVSGTNGRADGIFCSPSDINCESSPTSTAGSIYDHTFAAAGTFPYFCRPHASEGMVGSIVVEP